MYTGIVLMATDGDDDDDDDDALQKPGNDDGSRSQMSFLCAGSQLINWFSFNRIPT